MDTTTAQLLGQPAIPLRQTCSHALATVGITVPGMPARRLTTAPLEATIVRLLGLPAPLLGRERLVARVTVGIQGTERRVLPLITARWGE